MDMDFYKYLKERCWFAREIFLDEDSDNPMPTFVKIPESVLAPSREVKLLLDAIGEIFEVECMAAFGDILETEDGPELLLYGVWAEAILLVTCQTDEGEFICGIITPEGEYELLSIDQGKSIVALEMNEEVIEDLGLQYADEITNIHRSWMSSIGYDTMDKVYYPSFIYD